MKMLSNIKRLMLNERFVLVVIIINSVVIFLQESGFDNLLWLGILDGLCTLIFLLEMIVKQCELGIRKYWSSHWNQLDGILVVMSLPSLIQPLLPSDMFHLSFLLILRMLRVFRFFRIMHVFPNFKQIANNFGIAIRESNAVFVGLLIVIVIFALISCSLFKTVAPDYFATPLDSIYSIFRICTGEGWNEIPDQIASNSTHFTAHMVRIYFSFMLIACSIIGLSLVNSIFVDAMVSDNNDALSDQVKELNRKIDDLNHKIDQLQDK